MKPVFNITHESEVTDQGMDFEFEEPKNRKTSERKKIMKKFLALFVAVMTIALIGTCVYATNQDIGYYNNYAFDIGQKVIFPTTRTLYLPGSCAVNNNISISNSYFYTSAYDQYGTNCVTESKRINSGDRVILNYVNSQYENDIGAHYRLCMANQSSYGNNASGSWAPNLSDR